MNVRVYLAGPEVFLSNAREIGALKRAICERHGLVGVFPADEEDDVDPASSLGQQRSPSAAPWNVSCGATPRSARGCRSRLRSILVLRFLRLYSGGRPAGVEEVGAWLCRHRCGG